MSMKNISGIIDIGMNDELCQLIPSPYWDAFMKKRKEGWRDGRAESGGGGGGCDRLLNANTYIDLDHFKNYITVPGLVTHKSARQK